MKKIVLICICLFSLTWLPEMQAAKPIAKHVVMIAFDGWGSYSMKNAEAPAIRELMENGCYTLKKRSVLPSSSAINWASMFNGAGTEIHGYTTWASRTPEIPSAVTNKHGIFPTIYSLLQEQRPEAETGCLFEWGGIKYLVDSLAIDHVEQSYNHKQQPDELCVMAQKYIKEKKPTFVSICFDQLDEVGHGAGHDTPEYYKQLEVQDGYVKRIIETLKEAGMYDDTIIIFSADHGGIQKGHGGITLQEMETPFIIAGKNVRKGGEFQEMMMQYDVAATIAYIFKLEQPQAWIGRPMKQVFK